MSSATFSLLPAMRAEDALSEANRLAAGDVHGAARNAGRRAMMHLAEALGLGEAEQALIGVLLIAVEGQGSLTDYDLASRFTRGLQCNPGSTSTFPKSSITRTSSTSA